MSEHERDDERWLDEVRAGYHVPPDAPVADMWHVVARGLPSSAAADDGGDDLAARRAAHRSRWAPRVWIPAAAAALLVVGFGLGRVSLDPDESVPAPVASESPRFGSALRLATVEHLGRTESLLAMVRADARTGELDPLAAEWARSLLAETRLLLDAGGGGGTEVERLLQDLELVLAQIASAGGGDREGEGDERSRTELDLAIEGLEHGEVLPRIQAVLPSAAGA